MTSILGETLARTEGAELLALVEQVRAHAKEGRLDELPDFDLATDHPAGARVHGVLPPRQHHRAGPPRPRPDPGRATDEGGWLEQAVGRIADAGSTRDEVARAAPATSRVRPVFTAHPTEVARRSTIDKLRRVAALLEEPDSPAPDAPARGGGRAALAHRRDPDRAARADRRGAQRRLLPRGPLRRRPRRRARGAARPARAARRRPAARRAAAALRHLGRRRPRRQPPRHAGDHARGAHPPGRARHPAAAHAGRPAPARPLGQQPRRRGVRGAARRGSASCCPGCPRSSRATAGSTPRSPTGCSSPASTCGSGSPSSASSAVAGTSPGRDYADDTELLDDLAAPAPLGARAPGSGRRVAARSSGWSAPSPPPGSRWPPSTSASTPRSTTTRSGQLLDRVGELGTPYAELDRPARTKVLSEELAEPAPARPQPAAARRRGGRHRRDVPGDPLGARRARAARRSRATSSR